MKSKKADLPCFGYGLLVIVTVFSKTDTNTVKSVFPIVLLSCLLYLALYPWSSKICSLIKHYHGYRRGVKRKADDAIKGEEGGLLLMETEVED